MRGLFPFTIMPKQPSTNFAHKEQEDKEKNGEKGAEFIPNSMGDTQDGHDHVLALKGVDEVANQPTVGTPEIVEAEQDSQDEILQPLPFHPELLDRSRLTLNPMFPIHEGQAKDPEKDLPPSTFDVAKKKFKVYCWQDGQRYDVFDGHHHYPMMMAATYFVRSDVLEGRLVAVPAKVECLVFYESEGWTQDMIKKYSQMANFEGKKAVVIEPEVVTPSTDSIEVYVDCLAVDARTVRILSRDSKNNEMRVRQRASRVDSLNHNGRVYPRKVANQAVAIADEWAKSGLMTSELEHPAIVDDCSGGRCEQKFAHNPKRQTAVVNRIYPADGDGWIDIERTIKGNTPCGKIVMDAINKGHPLGISTRFHVRGKLRDWEGQRVLVADAMDICTFDDVENPAVDGAGLPSPVADSVLCFLTGDSETYSGLPNGQPISPTDGPYLGTPFFGENNNTINPPSLKPEQDTEPENDSRRNARALEEKHMLDIPRLINDFKATYGKPGANQRDCTADGCKIVHAIKDLREKGQCVDSLLKDFKAAFDSSTIAGYRGGVIEATVASEMGGEVGAGWGSEIETATGLNKLVHSAGMTKPDEHGTNALKVGAKPDAEPQAGGDARLKAMLDEHEEKEEKKKMKGEFEKAAEDHEDLKEMEEAEKDSLVKSMRKIYVTCKPGTDAKQFISTQIKLLKTGKDATAVAKADAIPALGEKGVSLTGTSSDGDTQGKTKGVQIRNQNRPWAAGTEKFLQATDNMCRKMQGAVIHGATIANPDDPQTIALRRANRPKLEAVLDDYAVKRMELARNNSMFQLAGDSVEDQTRALQAAVKPLIAVADDRMVAAVDTTTTAQVLNQPSVSEGLIVQGFQDLTALEFIMAMGPRGFNSLTGGFENRPMPIGTNLRIPSISYTNPSGWGYVDGFFDAGLQVPENVGIPPGNVDVSWLNFGLQKRRISCILTWDAIKAIGNGPGDISLLAWELYMMAARESRTIDNYLYNEMVNIAYEFNCVAVSAESYTTGDNLLPNNSVYLAAGPVVVNLNPQKKASAAVAVGSNNNPSDMSVTYPASVPAGIQQVVGACRLLAGGANTNAAPFYGFYNGSGYPGTIGPGPIVRPRSTATLSNAAGNTTNVTINPVTVTGTLTTPVQGEVTSSGGIWSYPGTTATFAIDYENGVIVFAAGAVTGSGTPSVITTSFAITYSYATNWVDFVADYNLAVAAGITTTATTQQVYHNGLLSIIDQTAASMGSFSNYVKPDCYLSNLINSAQYVDAQIFAPLFSPPGTELYPSPSAVAERNGVMLHRHNSSWVGRSQTGLLTRKGSTFYAQDTPFQIMGPVTVQDASGNPTGNISFYGIEFSVIGTRQPVDIGGNVLNCPNKVVISRLTKQGLGVF